MTHRKDGLWQEKIKLPDGSYQYYYGSTKSEVVRKIAEGKKKAEAKSLLLRQNKEKGLKVISSLFLLLSVVIRLYCLCNRRFCSSIIVLTMHAFDSRFAHFFDSLV